MVDAVFSQTEPSPTGQRPKNYSQHRHPSIHLFIHLMGPPDTNTSRSGGSVLTAAPLSFQTKWPTVIISIMCESRRKWTMNVIAKQQQDVFLLLRFAHKPRGALYYEEIILTTLGPHSSLSLSLFLLFICRPGPRKSDQKATELSNEFRIECLPRTAVNLPFYLRFRPWSWCGIYDDQCCFNNGLPEL